MYSTHIQILPVKHQHLATNVREIGLAYFGGNGDVIEETKAHRSVAFGMVAWRSDDRDSILHSPADYSLASFDGAASGKQSRRESQPVEVD